MIDIQIKSKDRPSFHKDKDKYNVTLQFLCQLMSRIVQFPLALELTPSISSPLGRIQCISSNLCLSQISMHISFHMVPITAGWTEAACSEKFGRHFTLDSWWESKPRSLHLSILPNHFAAMANLSIKLVMKDLVHSFQQQINNTQTKVIFSDNDGRIKRVLVRRLILFL